MNKPKNREGFKTKFLHPQRKNITVFGGKGTLEKEKVERERLERLNVWKNEHGGTQAIVFEILTRETVSTKGTTH